MTAIDHNFGTNIPELTVSDLAQGIKRALEEGFARVRVRGELGAVKIPSSGHLYGDLKDAGAVLNIICWKGSLSKLAVRPAEGLEVICTGKITSYPARSNYQMIVESMELAGEGALLKMLEDRRRKLAAEGLFDPARKMALPFLPELIGVVTSPTGAVIRDILHRLADRFPRPVLVWPVAVQGPGAAEQIAAAIDGFNNMAQPPDLIIVARGGGSLEDLMAFNEEIVVRAVAASTIPVIAAVGHETDTTLIDHVSDLRAPTPSAAAEMAVPRRHDLLAHVREHLQRLSVRADRMLTERHERLAAAAARLGDPQSIFALRDQRLDHLDHRLDHAFHRLLDARIARTATLGGKLRQPQERLATAQDRLKQTTERLTQTPRSWLDERGQRVSQIERLLRSFSYQNVLNRGFVMVRDAAGRAITEAGKTKPGQEVRLTFRNEQTVAARIHGAPQKDGL